MNKERIKGLIIGFLIATMLSATVAYANPQMREIVYGVGVTFNGNIINFEADSQPFIMGGRTFLPIRAVAELVGVDVSFDADTNTVLLTGGVPAPQPPTIQPPILQQPDPQLPAATPASLQSTQFDATTPNSAGRGVFTESFVSMGGNNFIEPVVFRSNTQSTIYSMHNLGGSYSTFSGTIGRVDGSPLSDATFTLIVDGNVIDVIVMTTNDMPREIDLNVSGVQMLRIEVEMSNLEFRGFNLPGWAIAGSVQ